MRSFASILSKHLVMAVNDSSPAIKISGLRILLGRTEISDAKRKENFLLFLVRTWPRYRASDIQVVVFGGTG